MSDILTRITLRGARTGLGLMDWGRKTRGEMLRQIRQKAAVDKKDAETILVATDDEFDVAIVRGSVVQHMVKKL